MSRVSQFADVDSELEVGEPSCEGGERNLAFQSRERGAEAEMDPEPECEVILRVRAREIELVAAGEDGRVAVRGGEDRHHGWPTGASSPPRVVLCRAARPRNCTGETNRNSSSVAWPASAGSSQSRAHRVRAQRSSTRPDSEEVGGRLVPSEEKNHEHRRQLDLAQPLLVLGADECLDERGQFVVLRAVAHKHRVNCVTEVAHRGASVDERAWLRPRRGCGRAENRRVPILLREDWTDIVLAGDPQRNQSKIYVNNHEQGAPVSRRVDLPLTGVRGFPADFVTPVSLDPLLFKLG